MHISTRVSVYACERALRDGRDNLGETNGTSWGFQFEASRCLLGIPIVYTACLRWLGRRRNTPPHLLLLIPDHHLSHYAALVVKHSDGDVCPSRYVAPDICRCLPSGAPADTRRCRLQRCGFDRRRRKTPTRSPSDSNEQSYTQVETTSSRSKRRAAHPPRACLPSPPSPQKSKFLISTKSTLRARPSTRYSPRQPSRSSPVSWRVSTAPSSPMARPRAGRRTP